MTKHISIIAVVFALLFTVAAFAADGNIKPNADPDAPAASGGTGTQTNDTVTPPAWETREGQEKAARMVLSGELTVHTDGSTTVNKTTIVRRGGGISARRASAMDREIERRGKRYTNEVGTSALAKANAHTDAAIKKLRDELDEWKRGVSDVVAGVNSTARWALGIAILALLVAIRGNFFPRARMPRTGGGY